MSRGRNHHRFSIRIHSGNFLIHVEKVAVFLGNDIFSISFDGITEIQVYAIVEWTNSMAGIDLFFCSSRGDISWCKIAE